MAEAVQSTAAEEGVLRRARAGEAGAFTAIVERYQDRLYNTAYRMTGSPEDARDVVQDTFVAAFEKLDRFEGRSSLYTWLYRIAVNASLSLRRHHRRRPAVSMSTFDAAGDEERAAPAWDDPKAVEPPDALATAETERLVHAALQELDPEVRTILVLRDIVGFDYRDLGGVLDLPEGTVKSRLHRARLALRGRLERVLRRGPESG